MPFPTMKGEQREAWIEIHSNWVLQDPNKQEWAKHVTLTADCKKDNISGKIKDIVTIGTNVIGEDPAIWLTGKYLEFVNSQCSLSQTYSLRDTTKEDFDKIVDEYLLSKRPTQISKQEQENLLKYWKEDIERSATSDIIWGWIVPILAVILFLWLYGYIAKTIFSSKTTPFQKIILFFLFFRGK
ncbi:hypothetical protein ACNSOP_03600 [Aliarcobacter lanthieri]